MTKARARQRAKANAAKKVKKRDTGTAQAAAKSHPGQFDPGSGSIKSPSVNPGGPGFSAGRKGAARSR